MVSDMEKKGKKN